MLLPHFRNPIWVHATHAGFSAFLFSGKGFSTFFCAPISSITNNRTFQFLMLAKFIENFGTTLFSLLRDNLRSRLPSTLQDLNFGRSLDTCSHSET